MGFVHPTAVVHSATRIHETASIGAFAVVEDGVEIGLNVVIAAHAVVRSGTILETGVSIDSFATIGGLPQDLNFDPQTPTGVRIGAGTSIREGVTVHRATQPGSFTQVGPHCMLMANSHVPHDACLGERVILANNVIMGGFARVGDYAFLGGGCALHQHVRVGEGAMVGGCARVGLDVAPFTMVSERNELYGLNVVGLRRRGFAPETIRELKQAYKAVFGKTGGARPHAAEYREEYLAAGGKDPRVLTFLEFFQGGKRGFALHTRRRDDPAEEKPGENERS